MRIDVIFGHMRLCIWLAGSSKRKPSPRDIRVQGAAVSKNKTAKTAGTTQERS
jgi:hypothetical protein